MRNFSDLYLTPFMEFDRLSIKSELYNVERNYIERVLTSYMNLKMCICKTNSMFCFLYLYFLYFPI